MTNDKAAKSLLDKVFFSTDEPDEIPQPTTEYTSPEEAIEKATDLATQIDSLILKLTKSTPRPNGSKRFVHRLDSDALNKHRVNVILELIQESQRYLLLAINKPADSPIKIGEPVISDTTNRYINADEETRACVERIQRSIINNMDKLFDYARDETRLKTLHADPSLLAPKYQNLVRARNTQISRSR